MMSPVDGAERTITLLGRVAIGPSGDAPEARASRGRRAELVFAYLAAEHHRLVTHDELADALWPHRLPDTWEAGLRGVLTELRRLLSDAGLDPGTVLTTMHRGYRMQLPAGVTLDLDDARESLAAARSCLAEGSAASAAERAARASSLAALPFRPNHEGEWVDGIRRELASINARALELETRAHAEAGDLAAASTSAERLVQTDPFNETAHQLRIRILGQAGDRSGAIRAFEHCRAVLAAELGVAPSDETTAAYRAAVDHDTPASHPHPRPAATPGGVNDLSVLVVEDHDFQRRTAAMLLRNLGIGSVAEASDGVDALAVLRTTDPPDVILCDIDMPGMDGVEFIHHVAESELAGAVIIASALDAKVIDAVRAVSEGCGLQVLGVIEKPLTARRLGELLATYQRRWRHPAAPGDASDAAFTITARDARTALVDGRITTQLQPVVDVATGRIAAANGVPRWSEPGRGWVPPGRFVPVLQRERLLAELSGLALAAACERGREFAALGLDLGITVEITLDGVRDTDLAANSAEVVRTSGVEPARISFSLDERALRTSPATALEVLTRLRVKGFGVSVGNFGTGRLGAELLGALPITEVQLAPVLVTGAPGEPSRVRALEEAVEAGRRLGVSIVGCGCDSGEDLRLLLELGCDRVAGTYIADAMPGDELPGWVAQWDPDRLVVGDERWR